MGIQEKFAHTRIYSPINLEFYIDKQYKTVKFLEHWMEFIASGSHNTIGLPGENKQINQNITNYFSRMQYPTYYKTNATRIFKFDRDYKNYLEYNFVGLFPLNMSSIQVGYNASSILTASVTFQYDRYIPGKTYTIAEVIGDSNNKDLTSRSSRATSGPTSDQEIKNQSLRQGFVNTSIPTQTVFNTPLLNVTKVAFGGDLNLF